MSFSTMYDGQALSTTTTVNEALSDSDTTITVADASKLPSAPNLAVIGTGEDAETILYTGISSNDLTGVTRGYNDTTNKAWDSGTQIARLLTEYDLEALQDNVEKLIENNMENLIIDGNFDYWLETTTETDPSDGDYVHTLGQVKHTKSSGTRPTMTLSRQTLTPSDLARSFYAARVAASAADSSLDNSSYYIAIRHYIYQGVRKYADGEKITISIKAKSSVAGQKIGILVRQNYGTSGSPSSEENLTGEIHTLTTSWAEYETTFTTNSNSGKTFGSDNNDALIVDIFVQCGSTLASSYFSGSSFGFTEAVNIDFAQFACYRGEESYDFVARDDDRAIKKFWRKSYEASTMPGTADSQGTILLETGSNVTDIASCMVYYEIEMMKDPTVLYWDADGNASKITLYSTGASSTHNTSPYYGFSWACRRGFRMVHRYGTYSALAFHYTADARY